MNTELKPVLETKTNSDAMGLGSEWHSAALPETWDP